MPARNGGSLAWESSEPPSVLVRPCFANLQGILSFKSIRFRTLWRLTGPYATYVLERLCVQLWIWCCNYGRQHDWCMVYDMWHTLRMLDGVRECLCGTWRTLAQLLFLTCDGAGRSADEYESTGD